ncbi:MAG: hypothetical protein KGD63_10570 [Candidatus Lokiarchaeota archaeon]|nr:hypothetical protein [Candidatus Lokiarchaeota archaeon]
MSLFSRSYNLKHVFSNVLNTIDTLGSKYKTPLILRMFGALNRFNLKIENRYILCNFLDQYGDLIGLKNNIYSENNERSLNQLFLMAYKKAKDAELLNELYQEYLDSIRAICQKTEMNFNE